MALRKIMGSMVKNLPEVPPTKVFSELQAMHPESSAKVYTGRGLTFLAKDKFSKTLIQDLEQNVGLVISRKP